MASQNRKYYEALANRSASVVVEGTIDTTFDTSPTINAKDAWEVFFGAPKCSVCNKATSATILYNFGGVCNRCHYQHRFVVR